jgi:hypothetical protein
MFLPDYASVMATPLLIMSDLSISACRFRISAFHRLAVFPQSHCEQKLARVLSGRIIPHQGTYSMPKGMFTQGVCVLFERTPQLDEIDSTLGDFDVRGERDANDEWAISGPSLIVAYRPESKGFVSIDTVSQVWPDHMGDPKKEPMIFAAWTMGNFGPFAYPGGLQRAAQQCWVWEPGKTVAQRHQAFVRIRSTYAFGAKDTDSIIPSDYESLPELEFVTKLASSVLALPGALCYFNPNGEVLRDQDGLRESLNFGWSHKLPPLDAWSNIRLFQVNREWSLMDTVGNGQLDIPDVEACFHTKSFECNAVDNFLRNISLYVLNNGDVIKDGDTMDGPGGIRWQSRHFENAMCDPPRQVLRWLPMDKHKIPPEIQ